MRARFVILILLAGLTCGTTIAHGNKVHVRGTVEKIGPDSMQVRTADGKTVEVKLASSTVYLLHVAPSQPKSPDANDDKPAKLGDLTVGDSVVIHATPKGGVLEADEVKFSLPSAGKGASPTVQKPRS